MIDTALPEEEGVKAHPRHGSGEPQPGPWQGAPETSGNADPRDADPFGERWPSSAENADLFGFTWSDNAGNIYVVTEPNNLAALAPGYVDVLVIDPDGAESRTVRAAGLIRTRKGSNS